MCLRLYGHDVYVDKMKDLVESLFSVHVPTEHNSTLTLLES